MPPCDGGRVRIPVQIRFQSSDRAKSVYFLGMDAGHNGLLGLAAIFQIPWRRMVVKCPPNVRKFFTQGPFFSQVITVDRLGSRSLPRAKASPAATAAAFSHPAPARSVRKLCGLHRKPGNSFRSRPSFFYPTPCRDARTSAATTSAGCVAAIRFSCSGQIAGR